MPRYAGPIRDRRRTERLAKGHVSILEHIKWLWQDLMDLFFASRRRRLTAEEQERFQQEAQQIAQETGKPIVDVIKALQSTRSPEQMQRAHESAKRSRSFQVVGGEGKRARKKAA